MSEKENPKESSGSEKPAKAAKPRKIQGNLPYSASPGVLKNILQAITTAERPDTFSTDFMKTVLNFSGGSARAAPPFLKKVGFLDSAGHPTDRYARFQGDSSRSEAALEGLKEGFSEIFKRNKFAHKANENEIKDIIVQITGLQKSDSVLKLILSSYEALRSFYDPSTTTVTTEIEEKSDSKETIEKLDNHVQGIGLSYHINIVLPASEKVEVFDAIFKSLKENLLK